MKCMKLGCVVPAFPTGHIALPALGRSQLGLKHAYRTLTGFKPKTFRPLIQSAKHYATGAGFFKFLYLFVFFRQFCILTVHSADFRLSPVFTAEAINYYSFPSSFCQSLPSPLDQSPLPPPPTHTHCHSLPVAFQYIHTYSHLFRVSSCWCHATRLYYLRS